MRPLTEAARSRIAGMLLAVVAPGALTGILVPLQAGQSRDFAFLNMAVVALLGLGYGLLP